MKRRVPFRQFHKYPPVYSLRVHWVPLFPSSQRLGAFAFSSHPGVHGFPALRLLCPLLPPLPFPCHSSQGSRVHHEGLQRNAVGGVLLNAPSPLWGFPILLQGK